MDDSLRDREVFEVEHSLYKELLPGGQAKVLPAWVGYSF